LRRSAAGTTLASLAVLMSLLDREISSRHERGHSVSRHERGHSVPLEQASSTVARPPAVPRTLRSDGHRAATPVLVDFGLSPAMKRVRGLVEHSSMSDLPVLITGEVGVGKDLIAHEIHRRSSRVDRPLLEVRCASLESGYFDSEALGAAGTMLLDDIGELTSELQAQLLDRLRRLDTTMPTGGAPSRTAAIRLIASAQQDIAHAVKAGTFSESLYYRINVIHIDVPPLRTRPEDITGLLRHFARKHGVSEDFPAELLARFRSYAWPGNARELENAVLRFTALHDPEYVLDELQTQPPQSAPCRADAWAASPDVPDHTDSGRSSEAFGEAVDLKEIGRRAAASAERSAIVAMLRHTMGNKKKAAQNLGISYKALLYKIHDFGIAESRRTPAREGLAATTTTSAS
jgi:DNA-binding NtrC family response regulator